MLEPTGQSGCNASALKTLRSCTSRTLVSHMHIGTVAILEGPPPPYDELAEQVRANLPQAPRYRQKVHFVPLALGRPVWVDDPHFNLDYHLRRTALPEPGEDEQLRLLVGRVMSQQLDRHKPLWEMWMIEGLSEDRWALVTKVHHAVADGVSGAGLMSAILDEQREPDLPPPEPWRPERQPSGAELAVRSFGNRALSPYEGVRSLLDSPRAAAEQAVGTVQGLLTMGGILRPPHASSLNGPIGPHRRWDWARSRLSDVKQIRNAFGGTVNDVVLTAIAGGFRELLACGGSGPTRSCARWCPCRCARPTSRTTPTTAFRRSSPTCRWTSRTRSSGLPRCTGRWSG